jgi:5'-methylthioadenosine phosphorylase
MVRMVHENETIYVPIGTQRRLENLGKIDLEPSFIMRLARDFPHEHEHCPIGPDRALDNALITAPEARDPELLKKLDASGRILFN